MLKKIENKIKKDIHLKELLKGTSISFIFKVGGHIIASVFTFLVTRSLGAEAWGIFALSYTLLLVMTVLGRAGFDTALVRFAAEFNAQGRKDLVKEVYFKAIKIVIPLSIIISLGVYFGSFFISSMIFKKPYLQKYFQLMSLAILPSVIVFINAGSLRGIKKITAYSFLFDVSKFLFAIIIFIILLLFYKNPSTAILSFVIGAFISSFISVVLWLKAVEFGSVKYSNTLKLSSLLDVSIPMLFSSSMLMMLWWADTIILGILATEKDVGIFNVCLKISTVAGFFFVAINSIAGPKFAEFYGKGDYKNLKKITKQSTKIVFFISLPVFILIFLFPSFILGIFGKDFRVGVIALFILTFSELLNIMAGPVGLLLQMTGKQKLMQNILFISVVVNVCLNFLLIPKFGINGAALANMCGILFRNIACLIYVKKFYDFYAFSLNTFRFDTGIFKGGKYLDS